MAYINGQQLLQVNYTGAVDQVFDPESPNAQSGIAIEERLKSKVLLDVTLTEEQAGASSVMVAIQNSELLTKAKMWNIRIAYPYSGEYGANTIWQDINLCNKEKNVYNINLAGAYNSKFTTGSETGSFCVTVFNTPFDFQEGGGSLISHYLNPNCSVTVSSANTANGARCNAYHYYGNVATAQNPAYLEFKTSVLTLEAGTRIYLEVIL